jgi:NAD(P)-dependent dehydrogenase (short-subunit alcohol dehydrogenase family)
VFILTALRTTPATEPFCLPPMAAYAASKHGIVGLTRSSAVEYARRGIWIRRPGPDRRAAAEGLPPEVRATIAAKTAMNRPGTLDEVAAVVNFLLSDEDLVLSP